MLTPTNIIYTAVRPSYDFKKPLALHGHSSWSVCALALMLEFIFAIFKS